MEVGEGIGDAPGGSTGGAGGSTLDPTKVVTIQIVAEIPEGGPPTGLASRVKESRDWAKTMVVTEFRGANQRLGHPVRADGTVVFVPPADRGELASIFSENLDLRGTIWTIRDENGQIPSAPIEVVRGQTTKVKISARTRLSVNATSGSMVLNPDLESMKRQFDDLTVLDTFTNGTFDGGRLPIQWDPTANVGRAKDPDGRKAFYAAIIDACHAGGIQCIVGMHHAGNTKSSYADEFHKWMAFVAALEPPQRDAAVGAFASDLDDFVFGSGAAMPDADGLSFDIEHVPGAQRISVAAQADFFDRFYRAIARRMAQRGKIVVIAVGQFGAAPGSRKRSLAELDAAFNASTSLTFTKSHPYSIAKGVPNIILRPMAFGRLAGANSGAAQFKWYGEIVEYALDFHGLHPRNFQLIFEMGQGDGQMSTFGQLLPKVCSEILRPNRVGMAPFAHGTESWTLYATHDGLLNPGERRPGTRGQPVQFPRWAPP